VDTDIQCTDFIKKTMAITPISPNFFIVDTEAERSTGWADGVMVFCKDTNKTYVLKAGTFKLLGLGVNLTIGVSEPSGPVTNDLWIDTT